MNKPSFQCNKCEVSSNDLQMIQEGGASYLFCEKCSEKLDGMPTGSIHSCLGSKKETWVARNMRIAKEKRTNGESPWING